MQTINEAQDGAPAPIKVSKPKDAFSTQPESKNEPAKLTDHERNLLLEIRQQAILYSLAPKAEFTGVTTDPMCLQVIWAGMLEGNCQMVRNGVWLSSKVARDLSQWPNAIVAARLVIKLWTEFEALHGVGCLSPVKGEPKPIMPISNARKARRNARRLIAEQGEAYRMTAIDLTRWSIIRRREDPLAGLNSR